MRARVRKVELYCHHDGARPVWRVWGLIGDHPPPAVALS
jgi:hypothetical protein